MTGDALGVQVTFTLSNLDAEAHEVWVMIDPWNEFGRYEPAIVVSDDEAFRDFSGIDMLYRVPGLEEPVPGGRDDARLIDTFTFEDMDELAIDFATVFRILSDVVVGEDAEEDPRSTLVNHAFNVRNRTYDSPLLDRYRPEVVPGLTGFDFGIRTSEPANVALEIVVEILDRHGGKVADRGQRATLLEASERVISSTAAP